MKEFRFGDQVIESEVDDNIMMLLLTSEIQYLVLFTLLLRVNHITVLYHPFSTEGKVANGIMNGEPLFTDKMQAFAFKNMPLNHLKLPQPHVYYDLMQLVDWVRDNKPSIATAEHARHVIEIIETGWESAATGRAVELKTTFTPVPLEN